jgi:hypothetical protein
VPIDTDILEKIKQKFQMRTTGEVKTDEHYKCSSTIRISWIDQEERPKESACMNVLQGYEFL